MKKYIAGLVIISSFLISTPALASSLSEAQIQAITSLLSSFGADSTTVDNVKAVLSGQVVSGTSPRAACITLTNNLYADTTDATTDGEVSKLQQFLGGSITGYFGPATLQLVQNWQTTRGIVSSGSPDTTGYGYAGPKTRTAMSCTSNLVTDTNSTMPAVQTTPIQSNSQTTPAPTTPSMPSATPTMPATACINCSPTVLPTSAVIQVLSPNGGEQWQAGGTYTIKYSAKNIAGNENLLIYLQKGYDAPTTKTGVNSGQLIGVTTNLESYTYAVPPSIQSGNNYTIKVMGAGAYYANNSIYYVEDSSDATFSIAAWPNNTSTPAPATPALQSSGQTTTSTAQVPLSPSIKVLSPNGVETLTTGQTYMIKWTGGGNSAIDVSLLDNLTRLGKKIFSGIPNNNSISWVATPLSSSDLQSPVTGTYATPSGQYVIFVGCTDNNCTVDDSDSYFKIAE